MTTRPLTLVLGVLLLSLGACKKDADSKPPGDEAADKGGGDGGGGEAEAGGGGGESEEILTVDVFEETMQSKQGEVADCFTAAKEANPKLSGKLVLAVTVGGDGAVTAVKFDDASTIKEASITTCVEEKARGWKFPKTRDGKEMTQPYSLNLS